MTDKEVLRLIERAYTEELTSLDLSGQQMVSLPSEVFRLKKLKSLFLNDNKFKRLPDSFGQLKALMWLDVSNNKLVEVPVTIGDLQNLSVLNVSNNCLSKIPKQIKQLRNLTSLDLSNNRIVSLPKEISHLKTLTQLDLSGNRIRTLPIGVTSIKSLTWLYINDNQLTIIPARISKLRNLGELQLRGNKISELSSETAKLPGLVALDLRDNQLDWPDNVIDDVRSPNALLDFLTQLKDKKDNLPIEESLYEAKILIVGEAEAGKTSLTQKIQNPRYELKDEKSTVGIDVSHWHYKKEGKQYRINIWDFSGQEIDYATHQFFLTEQSLYILVLDNRREDTNFRYWLDIIRSQAADSPLIIVKNEKQGRKKELHKSLLIEQFDNLKEVLSVDLSDNRGLPELIEEVKHQIKKLPHVGETPNKNWVRVRKTIESNGANYITQQAFCAICQSHGLIEHQSKLQLSRYLHLLGICLHFQDNILLAETVFLKPTWLTNAIYKVLDDQQINNDKGLFTINSLFRIWKEEEYMDMHSKLLELMTYFRMCYKTPALKDSYIVPQLLDFNCPNEYQWDSSDNLVLQYQYAFMPKGIFPRFIAEVSPFIYEGCVWRDGIIITYQNDGKTKAEVIEEYRNERIIIAVSGEMKRDLLNAIVSDLDRIHANFKNIECERLVPCRCESCRNSTEPSLYEFNNLKRRLTDGKFTIECKRKPYEDVEIHSLIEDYHLGHLLTSDLMKEDSVTVIVQNHRGSGDNIAKDKTVDN